jgi:hypothetical protein
MTLKYAATLLQSENAIELNKFYDRNHSITDWYYQAYCSENHHSIPNSIANILKQPRGAQVCGDVLIIKNGPLDGIWEACPDVNTTSLAQTIWWYKVSGQDISTIFGERGFSRVLQELSD